MPYNRKACLGSGFFGEVWLEEDLGLSRLCAAKYLNPTRLPAGVKFAEAQVMLDAEHDNVVRVYSADTEQDDTTGVEVPVIRMEYLPGGSIADRYQGEPLPVADALHVLEEACRGVEALHAREILHRNLKPANLLIGEGGTIKVSDFGLACEVANVVGPLLGAIPSTCRPRLSREPVLSTPSRGTFTRLVSRCTACLTATR